MEDKLLIKTKFQRIQFPFGKKEYLLNSELAPNRLAKIILIYIHEKHFGYNRIFFDWQSSISTNVFKELFRRMLNDIFDYNDELLQLAFDLNLEEKTASILDDSGLCYVSDFTSKEQMIFNINPNAEYAVYLTINPMVDIHHSKDQIVINCDREHLLINEIEKRLTLYLNISIEPNLYLRGKIETIRPKKDFVEDVAQVLSELKFYKIYELE